MLSFKRSTLFGIAVMFVLTACDNGGDNTAAIDEFTGTLGDEFTGFTGNLGAPGCKILPETDVAIYVGGGIGPNSALWAEALMEFWKTGSKQPGQPEKLNDVGAITWEGDANVNYVTLTLFEFNACSAENFAGLKLFLMPGGSAYEIQDNLGSSGKSKLTDYLNSGGNYIGFCAGGYYAAKGYFWKGDDGAPVENCKNKWCRYETNGTFSFDDAAGDFTVHEWNGTSYHSELLAYGPLENILVEGPIEEIAGPWHDVDSTPKHPYDSHLITTDDTTMPELRVIYWGGATDNYIYTNNAPWGKPLAHFSSDFNGNNDLDFPQAEALWALKSVPTGQGGHILISSAHIEASLFHNGATFDNGGMTECQQYNNYAYLLKSIKRELGLTFAEPEYDTSCSNSRAGEVKNTADLFPGGLAYQNATRITTATGGGDVEGNSETGFEAGNLGNFTLVGDSAANPWSADSGAACVGAYAARAGHPSGVDSDSSIRLEIPDGVKSITYKYSYPSALDTGDDFHVIVNDSVVVREYETGPGTNCSEDTIVVAGGGSLTFRCRSSGLGETCTVDEIVFNY